VVEARDFSASGCPDWLSAQTQALLLGGEADMRLTVCLPIVLRLRMNAILPPVFLYAFMACTFLPLCSFGFFLYSVNYTIFGIVGIS